MHRVEIALQVEANALLNIACTLLYEIRSARVVDMANPNESSLRKS
jgi:hypothetical protein